MKKVIAGVILATMISFLPMNAFAGVDMNIINPDVNTYAGPKPPKIEHLDVSRKALSDNVQIFDDKMVIEAGNVIKIAFEDKFTTKNLEPGTKVNFYLKKDLKTEEGSILLPQNTRFIATVKTVQKPKVWNRNAQAYLLITDIILPQGQTGCINAEMFGKNGMLKKSSWAAVGKAAGYTVGLFGIGAGLGAGIGAFAKEAGLGALAFGMPIGAGVGLIIGTVTPGLHYKAKPGKQVKIKLNQDFDIVKNK